MFTFATYSGKEACFLPASFDTCFGTAVVHHITDVQYFLAQVHSLLRPGGRAFFMEPNFEFHRALTATMADVTAELMRDSRVSKQDIHGILNWIAEVHCNVINSGDLEILAEREDKHLFVAQVFEEWGKAAGFGVAVALPCDPDPTGWNTIQVYLGQNGVGSQTLAAIQQYWQLIQAHHFGQLSARDQSPSYLFWLQKVTSRHRPEPATPATSRWRCSKRRSRVSAELWLEIQARRHDEGVEIFAAGWCLASGSVRAIQITSGGIGRKLPIWRPRPDVHTRMNTNGKYPPLCSLCSGIEGRVRLGSTDIDQETVRLELELVTVDGRLLPAGTATPTLDGKIYKMHKA
jgi:hypothetical protein